MIRWTNFFYFSQDICAQFELSKNVIGWVVFQVELNKKIGFKTSKKRPGAPVIGIPPSIKLLSGFNHNCLETLGCFFRSYLRMAAFSILETPWNYILSNASKRTEKILSFCPPEYVSFCPLTEKYIKNIKETKKWVKSYLGLFCKSRIEYQNFHHDDFSQPHMPGEFE